MLIVCLPVIVLEPTAVAHKIQVVSAPGGQQFSMEWDTAIVDTLSTDRTFDAVAAATTAANTAHAVYSTCETTYAFSGAFSSSVPVFQSIQPTSVPTKPVTSKLYR